MSSEGENVTSTGPSQSGDGPQQQNGSGQAPEGMDMLQKVWSHSLILLFMTVFLPNQIHCQSIIDLMPGDIEGWTLREPVKVYTPETLYDYIDGGAELYLSYGTYKFWCRIAFG